VAVAVAAAVGQVMRLEQGGQAAVAAELDTLVVLMVQAEL
jgi:hypothetical protein